MYKYQKVYHHLKEKILNETYPPESQLPSEMGIASEYSVDRSTVRRALKYLSDEGLIEKRAGKEATVCGKTHKSITAPNETNKIGYLLPLGYKINEIFYSNLFYAIEKSFQTKGYTLIYSSLENSLLKICRPSNWMALSWSATTIRRTSLMLLKQRSPACWSTASILSSPPFCQTMNKGRILQGNILSKKGTGTFLSFRESLQPLRIR